MNNYNKQDKDFLDSVWSKVRYAEYVKAEQAKVKENNRRITAAKIKFAMILAAAVIMISVPMLIISRLDSSNVLGVGLTMLSAGVIYEYYSEKENNRRETYGNKY